ncbi:MAG: YceI family protein [Candidatus Hydrothermia bacterium]|jgi:polyisoprenoid-binding protein YceI
MIFLLFLDVFEIVNQKSKIIFWTNASFHKVVGRAEEIYSTIKYDSNSISGYVKVLSKSLKTDNAVRDAQMYRTINANKYEFIEFIPESIRNDLIFGKFKLSGLEKNISVPISLKFNENNAYVSGSFFILLSDFKLERPKFGFLQVSDTIYIEFNLIYQRK